MTEKKQNVSLEEHLETLKKKGHPVADLDLAAGLNELGARLAQMIASTNEGFTALGGNDAKILDRIVVQDAKLTELDKAAHTLANTSDRLVTQDAELLALIEESRAATAAYEARLSGVETRVSGVEERVAKLEAAQPTGWTRAGKGLLIAVGALTVGAVAGGLTAGVVIRRQDRRREAEARKATFTSSETITGGSLPPGVQNFVN